MADWSSRAAGSVFVFLSLAFAAIGLISSSWIVPSIDEGLSPLSHLQDESKTYDTHDRFGLTKLKGGDRYEDRCDSGSDEVSCSLAAGGSWATNLFFVGFALALYFLVYTNFALDTLAWESNIPEYLHHLSKCYSLCFALALVGWWRAIPEDFMEWRTVGFGFYVVLPSIMLGLVSLAEDALTE